VTYVQRESEPGGKICWYQWTEHALTNETGDIYEYQAVGRDITIENELEKQSKTNIRNMEFLCQTAMEFAEISTDVDIYRFIGERLLHLVPDSIVGVLTYDPEKDVSHIKYVSNNTLILKIKEITGNDLYNMPLHIGAEIKRSILDSGRLIRIPSSSGIFRLKDLPEREVSGVLREFDVGEIFLASLTWNKSLFGSVAIAVRDISQIGDPMVIETFITQAAITIQRKLATEALSESERRFRSITDLSPFPIAILGEDGRYLYINKRFSEVFGYTSMDLKTGMDWFRVAYPDPVRRTEALQQWKIDLKNSKVGDVRRRQFRVRCRDGSMKDILFSPVTMPDRRQCIIYEDITGQKHSESVRSLLAAIVESSNDAIVGTDKDGSITTWNRAAEEIYGYSVAEIVGMPVSVLMPADGRSRWTDLIARVMQGERISHFGARNVRKDGRIIDVSISISPITDANGETTGVSGIIRDVTVQIRRERERIIMESAIASSINAIGIADLDGSVTHVNEAFLRMWGYEDPAEVLGRPIEIYAHEDGHALDDIKEVIGALFREGRWRGEVLARKKDGTEFYVQLSASTITDDRGEPLCLMASFVDTTFNRMTENTGAVQDKKRSDD
jgi:PAS domain S-box-containing protein